MSRELAAARSVRKLLLPLSVVPDMAPFDLLLGWGCAFMFGWFWKAGKVRTLFSNDWQSEEFSRHRSFVAKVVAVFANDCNDFDGTVRVW